MLGYENVEPSQLQELLQSGGILLIDVRTPTESARGGIPGARNIPLHLLPLRTKIGAKLIYGVAAPAHPSTAVPDAVLPPPSLESCACGTGASMRGGILAWLQCGQPVSTGFLN